MIRFWRLPPVWRCVIGWLLLCAGSFWVCLSTKGWLQRIFYCCATAWSARVCRCSPRETGRLHRSPKHTLLLVFIHNTCLRVFVCRDKAVAKPPPDPRLPPPSCLLLPPTPRRGRKAPVSSRTNMHVLVDAGLKVGTKHGESAFSRWFEASSSASLLQLLHLSLKKSKVTSSETSTLEMLDPFVTLLLDCLNSMHVKVLWVCFFLVPSAPFGQSRRSLMTPDPQVITEALAAFTCLMRFPLPAVDQNANQLSKQLFVLLRDYSKAGAARGENYHLVQNCFKVPQVTTGHLQPSLAFKQNTAPFLNLTKPCGCSLSDHHHVREEHQKQQDFGDAAAGAPGIRWGGHLWPVPPGHRLWSAEGSACQERLCRLREAVWPHTCPSPPGNLVQEANSSRDGGGVEESCQALCHRQQRHDQNSLSPGIC